jgi:CRP-like cAMP-binding protein
MIKMEEVTVMSCNHYHIESSCLHRVPVFEHLMEDEMIELSSLIQYRHFKKGEFIFQDGEKSNYLFVVNEGIVKLSKLSDHGKEQIIRFLFPGDFFGQFALLQETTHYANAEVLDASVVCTIHKSDFHKLLEKNSKMAYRFLLAVSERLHQADEWLGNISLLETGKRLAKMLVLFYEKNHAKPSFQLPVQKKELAAWLGTTPETLSRKLAHFEELGIITIDKKRMTILQPEKLRSYSE